MKIHEDVAAIFTAALSKAKTNFNRDELLEIQAGVVPSVIQLEEEDFIKAETFFKRIKRAEKWESIKHRKNSWLKNPVYFYRSMKSTATKNLRYERKNEVEKWFEDEFPEGVLVEDMESMLNEFTFIAFSKLNLLQRVRKFEGQYGFDKQAVEALKEVLG